MHNPLDARVHAMCDHMNRILEVLALAAPFCIPREAVPVDRYGHTEQLMELGLVESDPTHAGCVRLRPSARAQLLVTMGPLAQRYAARAASRALQQHPEIDRCLRMKIDELRRVGWG